MQLESPSGWMPPSFSNFYEYTLPTAAAAGSWTQLNPGNPNEPRWRRQPVVLEDPSTGNAIGLYSPDILNSTTAWFVWNNFGGSTDGSDTSWWSFISQDYGSVTPRDGSFPQGIPSLRNQK
jgi:hypothetical protein